ncbi:MAG: Ig-like domain-containing protein [Candidatus Symbiothrix sp.]|nr:Ig-like domain-containing protein [Candidatus Symbiothrix sp.]
MRKIFSIFCLFFVVVSAYAQNFGLDDIQLWAGEGSNRAGLVVQWNDPGETHAMVWGYQWDGTAYGIDLIFAVAKADPRFYAMTEATTSGYGSAIAGLGYDANGDGVFTIKDKTTGVIIYPDENGVFTTASGYNYDNFVAGDPEDYWGAGWYSSYWSYWTGTDNTNLGYSGLGASGRRLTDGCWDGWNFNLNMSSYAFKEMIAAEPDGYTNGIFLLANKDAHSTINLVDKKGVFAYNIYPEANNTLSLNTNTRYSTIFGNNIYFVSGNTATTTGSLIIADAKKLTHKGVIDNIDGRAFTGISAQKGYVSTANGIYAVDIENYTLGEWVSGTNTGETGVMIHSGKQVFAVQKTTGILVIDTQTNSVVKTIAGNFSSIAQSKDGSVWGAAETKLVRINPETLVTEEIILPVNAQIGMDWEHWNAGSFFADAKENVLYWVNSAYTANPTSVYRYEIGNASSLDCPFYSLPRDKNTRFSGAAVRKEYKTNQLVITAEQTTGATKENRIYRIDAETADLLNTCKPDRYWGETSLIAFPDNAAVFGGIASTYTFPLNSDPLVIPVAGMATDKDDLDYNIRLSVTSDSPQLVTAGLEEDNLTITPLPEQSGDAKVTLTALSNGKTSKKDIGISITRALEGIAFEHPELTLKTGSTDTLKVVFTPSNASNKTVTWSYSNYSAAYVSNGVVTARGAGQSTITARSQEGNFTAECVVTVVNEPLTAIALNKTQTTVYVNQRDTLLVDYTPSDASVKTMTWTSSNTAIVTVSNSSNRGILLGRAAGTATITGKSTDGGFIVECAVTVAFNPATKLTLNTNLVELNVPAYATLTGTFSPANASNQTINWISSDPTIATVNTAGRVTAVAAGETQIIAQSADNSALVAVATVKVSVIPVTGLTFTDTVKTVAVAQRSYTIPRTITPADAGNKNINWTSSDEELATVNTAGTVTLKKPGIVTITGITQDGGFATQCKLNILDSIHVTGITLTEKEAWLKVGGTKYLPNAITPSDATLKTYSFAFENPDIVGLSSPTSTYIKALALGDCKVTLTTNDGGFSDTCLVHVVPNVEQLILSAEEKELIVGETFPLTASVLPAAARQTVNWDSSDKTVATVDANGVVSASKAGTTLIIATSADNANQKDTCQITVTNQISTAILLNATQKNLWVNDHWQVNATVLPANTTNQRIAWTSSDYSVADVNSQGYITASQPGTAIITVVSKDGGATQSCEITVKEIDYTAGVFFVNEDWFGRQNSSLNFLSADGNWVYNAYSKENPGKELGCTSSYGTIYGDKFYLVSKQAKDPGATVTGNRLAVCDATTLQSLKEFETIGQDANGNSIADGRSFLGVDEQKGYIGSSNGIWLYDMENMQIEGQVQNSGGANPTDLYSGQIGNMLRAGERVFAVHQNRGLMVIDAQADTIQTVIAAPLDGTSQRGFGSIVQSKDGNLWLSIASDVNGSGGAEDYLLKLNPRTLDTTRVVLPAGYAVPNSWYAWTPDGFCSSKQENKLYWTNVGGWFAATKIYGYDITNGQVEEIYDLAGYEDGSWGIYGAGFRVDPVTDNLYISLYQSFESSNYRTIQLNPHTKAVDTYLMDNHYWFPTLPVFPDNFAPVVADLNDAASTGLTPFTVSLEGLATDADNLDAAIVQSIVAISDEDVLSAKIVNDELEITPLQSGTSTLTIRFNSNGKTVDKDMTVSISGTGIKEIVPERIAVYPNPFAEFINVDTAKDGKVVIYDQTGKAVLSATVKAGNNRINTSALSKGVYILKQGLSTVKIIK